MKIKDTIECGLCIPCSGLMFTGVIRCNKNGMYMDSDYASYRTGCEWWNENIASGRVYKSLREYFVSQPGKTDADGSHSFDTCKGFCAYTVGDITTGKTIMSIDAVTGRVDIDSCASDFREFAMDWNAILTGELNVSTSDDLNRISTEPAVISGSIFDSLTEVDAW